MNKKYAGLLALIVGVGILIVGVTWRAGGPPPSPTTFPQQLDTLILSNAETGKAALRSIKRLHGLSFKLKMLDAAILDYQGGDGESLRVWVSTAKDRTRAVRQMEYMTKRIRPTSGFTRPEKMALSKVEYPFVYHVEGGGGSHHYYYVKGNKVYWVALMNVPPARRARLVEAAIEGVD